MKPMPHSFCPAALRTVPTRFSCALLALMLAGCSTTLFDSDKIDYKSARPATSNLEVPPDLTAPSGDDRYLVPDSGAAGGVATYSAYTSDRAQQPQVSTGPEVLSQIEGMHIERAGTQRWLVAPGDAATLWPRIKDFWVETGFVIDIDRPQVGIMETDWAEDRAKIPLDFLRATIGRVFDSLYSTSLRDRFRTRVEPGQQPGTVEIYISHRGVEEVYTSRQEDTTVWQPRASDPGLEAEMMRRLMVFLGTEEERAAEMVRAAEQAPTEPRAQLQEASRETGPQLFVDEPFDRAWRRVGLALDRVGFTVEDRNRADGIYFVRYIDPDIEDREESRGMLGRLAFWRSGDKETGERAPDDNQYRVRVAEQGGRTMVTIEDSAGRPDTSPLARRILGLLETQLR